MTDVFNTDTTFGSAIKGTMFKLVVAGGTTTDIGALVQEFGAQYQRQINRIYELGSRQQSYIEGPTAGQLSLSQVVGPTAIVDEILTTLGDICQAEQNTVTLSAGAVLCDGNSSPTVTFNNVVASSTTLSANVGNFIIQKSLAAVFTTMSV
jgi:hypothetical protein